MYIWLLKLSILLILAMGKGQAQRTIQEAFMIQYFERRFQQLEDRLSKCDQNIQQFGQRMYDLTTEMHGQLNKLTVYRAEGKSHVDSVAMRVDRVERDIEYLQNKIPDQHHVEMEEHLLEQQVKEAQLKKKANITLGADCSTVLTGVKSLKIVKKAGSTHGSWLKDPSKGSVKVYFFSGTRNNTLLEFASLKSFTDGNLSRKATRVQLPLPWQGTGHVVYNGFVYYHQADTPNQILKVHLLNRTVSDSMLLPGAGRMPVYSLSTHTFLALAVDEMGLWAIHADPDFGGNLVITKVDAGSLAVEHTWDTTCKSQNAEAALVVCGTLYVVYNTRYGGRSSVQCLYDIHDTIHTYDTAVLFFPKRYTSHSAMHYHPKEKQVYAWDDGYQTIYKIDTTRKVTST